MGYKGDLLTFNPISTVNWAKLLLITLGSLAIMCVLQLQHKKNCGKPGLDQVNA